MINPRSPMRRHTRFPVRWRAVYGNGEFLAEGTVLDLTARGWRVAGSMPVVPGMPLRLQVCVPDKPEPLHVLRATVLWVHDHEFAIEAQDLGPIDQAWIAEFLKKKLGLMWMSSEAAHEISLQAGGKTFRDESPLPQPSVPLMKDVLQRFLTLADQSTDPPAGEPAWDGDREGESVAHGDHVHEGRWNHARRILHGILAIRAARARTGLNPSANN